jgi:beta-xylosidase
MTGGFFVSQDLLDWKFHVLPSNISVYDYAPDVRVLGEYLYFSASKMQSPSSFFRTRDPMEGRFEEIKGAFPFWDPNLFVDDDGRVYFYWGSSNSAPIYGIELDSATMLPVGGKRELIFGDGTIKGYERPGDNHVPPKTPELIEAAALEIAKRYMGVTEMNQLPEDQREMPYRAAGNDPYIEGAWMTKRGSTYYLQYAFSGTEYNVYGDGCYVGDAPLGPFKLAKNNPFSYKPGGFITGTGHGSLLEDKNGHPSTIRIILL